MLHEIFKGMDNAAEKINENFEGINDYVIEQGGNYTKWNSGKLECWGSHRTKDIVLTRTTTLGFPGYYTNDIYIDLPIDFVGTAFPNANLAAKAYTSPHIVAIGLEGSNQLWTVISQQPSSWENVTIFYHVIGRWK